MEQTLELRRLSVNPDTENSVCEGLRRGKMKWTNWGYRKENGQISDMMVILSAIINSNGLFYNWGCIWRSDNE